MKVLHIPTWPMVKHITYKSSKNSLWQKSLAVKQSGCTGMSRKEHVSVPFLYFHVRSCFRFSMRVILTSAKHVLTELYETSEEKLEKPYIISCV